MYTDRQLFLAVAIALSSGFGLGVGVALAAVGKLDALRWVPLLLLGGCASVDSFQYDRNVANTPIVRTAPAKGEVTIAWHSGTPEYIHTMCQWKPGGAPIHGCAVLDEVNARCVLFFVTPAGLMDKERLAVMGHEAWHCLGMKHAQAP